jgi:hypothetical protein
MAEKLKRASRRREPRVHIVSHTHWDREWYHTADVFRQRLVALVDELLDSRDVTPRAPFLLDGQAVLLEDYLAVRPEREEELRAAMAAGRLECGPWYVLQDELIPYGETQIRNLLAGRRVMRRLGGRDSGVLYSPDSFGHPASLPMVAAGFNCRVVVLRRGFGGRSHPPSNAAWWKAPDGSTVLLYHMTRSGYELGRELPTHLDEVLVRWTEIKQELLERNALDDLLLLNGADHHFLQPDRERAVLMLSTFAFEVAVQLSSLRRFAAAALKSARNRRLPRVGGELRDSYGFTWTLQGTLASRTSLKRLLAAATHRLEREAEPWTALAMVAGGPDLKPQVDAAWKSLLLALPHDTICGTVTDDAAVEAALRLSSSLEQATELAQAGVEELIHYDRTEARDLSRTPEGQEDGVLLINPAGRTRGGVADVEILVRRQEIRVGPDSTAQPPPWPQKRRPRSLVVFAGSEPVRCPLQFAGSEGERISLLESPRRYPGAAVVEAQKWLTYLPPQAGYSVAGAETSLSRPQASGPSRPAFAGTEVIGNGRVAAGVDQDGRVWIECQASRRRVHLALQSQADYGDLYTPSLRGAAVNTVHLSRGRIRMRGPLRASLEATFKFSTAVENRVDNSNVRDGFGKRAAPGEGRGGRSLGGNVRVVLSIDADSAVVRITCYAINTFANHRLRLLILSDLTDATVASDAPFGVVHRECETALVEPMGSEQRTNAHPLHRHITILNQAGAMTVLSDGSPEYECQKDGSVAVTLVRSVGQLSLPDLPERPGNAGWPAATPLAQELGPLIAELGWMAHSASTWDAVAADVIAASDDFLHPLRGITLRASGSILGGSLGVDLEGDGLALSALKKAEDGRSLVIRCVNTTGRRVRGVWRFEFPVKRAVLARLDETRIGGLPVRNGREVPFQAAPHATVTILVVGSADFAEFLPAPARPASRAPRRR